MPDRKDRMALLSRFDKHYKLKYSAQPNYNKWVEQWAADSLIESYTLKGCYDLLQYYFDTAQNPDWKYFANYAHAILESKINYENDIKEREARRKMAKEWLSE